MAPDPGGTRRFFARAALRTAHGDPTPPGRPLPTPAKIAPAKRITYSPTVPNRRARFPIPFVDRDPIDAQMGTMDKRYHVRA